MARGGAGGRGPSLRIISGEFGGRRLTSPREGTEEVRPSTERTREAIFSMLGPLEGESVLDLFCGSGALGLEALSRGAAELTLVDIDLRTAEANVEALGVEERCLLQRADALSFLGSDLDLYDLVLCDPPYRLADRFADDLDKLLADRLQPGARVVVESSPKRPLRLSLPLQRERRYGAALVHVYGGEQ